MQKISKFIFLVVALTLVLGFLYYKRSETFYWPGNIERSCRHSEINQTIMRDDQDFRRRIANELLTLHNKIRYNYVNEKSISSDWLLCIKNIAMQMDARVATGMQISRESEKSAYLPNEEPPRLSQSGSPRHVCPQVYLKEKEDPPYYQHGMEFMKCNYVPLISDVISFVISLMDMNVTDISYLQQIQKQYKVHIIVLTNGKFIDNHNYKNIKFMFNTSEGNSLNNVLETIKTPYVLIGQGIVNFNNQSSIERLIGVLDDLDKDGVQLAGGSVRDITGRWTHGCLQFKVANYKAKYKLGYFYSRHECMICDDILGPFVASTRIMKSIKFSEDFKGPQLIRDWFLKFQKTNYVSVTCPDVMFYVKDHQILTKQQWKIIAKKWQFVYLDIQIIGDRQIHKFTCKDLNINCNGYWNHYIKSGIFVPPCCVDMYTTCIGNVLKFGEDLGLNYELQDGTALGAMKFSKVFPWDIDADIAFKCKDWPSWMKMKDHFLKHHKYKMIINKDKVYFIIRCIGNFFIEFHCQKKLSNDNLPTGYSPTLNKIGEHWLQTQANPGLYLRNRYKFDDTHHTEHWRLFNATDETNSIGKRYVPSGLWTKCLIPDHHSCQDKYQIDGDIPIFHQFW